MTKVLPNHNNTDVETKDNAKCHFTYKVFHTHIEQRSNKIFYQHLTAGTSAMRNHSLTFTQPTGKSCGVAGKNFYSLMN